MAGEEETETDLLGSASHTKWAVDEQLTSLHLPGKYRSVWITVQLS